MIFLQVFFCVIFMSFALPSETFNLGCPILALFSLCPLMLALREAASYLKCGLCFGFYCCFLHIASSWWLGNFEGFALFTLGASALGTGFLGFCFGLVFYALITKKYQCLQYKIFFLQNNNIKDTLVRDAFLFSSIYVIYEWVKSTGFLGFPWGTLSMCVYQWGSIKQIADITGVWGVTFVLCLFNFAVFALVYYKKYAIKLFCFVFVLFSATLFYGGYKMSRPPKIIASLNTVIVQNNANPWAFRNTLQAQNDSIVQSMQQTDRGLLDFKKTGDSADIVVWSEGVLKKRFPAGYSFYEGFPYSMPLIQYIKKTHTPFLIGGSHLIDNDPQKPGNAALLFDSSGDLLDYYIKVHLVPFAEVIPFYDIQAVKNFLFYITGFAFSWTPGVLYKTFPLKTGIGQVINVATPICFEDAFFDVCGPLVHNGAQVFLNITNDSWSLTKSAQYQHFVIASYKSIEFKKALVRSCQSGYSVVTDATGNIIKDLPMFTPCSMAVKVPIYENTKTIYSIYGNYMPKCLCLCVLFLLFYYNAKQIKRQHLWQKSLEFFEPSCVDYSVWDY